LSSLPTANQERFFTSGYRRVLLDGIGHFPHREAPDQVAQAIDRHLRATAAR
jgi:pimeloyl-ACP methyl ester carboxylesterase